MGLIERHKSVVKYLRDTNEWVKGSDLAKLLDVTDRTIRNDIISINRFYEKDIIISVKGKGYRYNDFGKESNTDYITDIGVLTTIERWVYIVKKLIVFKDGINLFDLAEELFISESTLQNDIIKIKRVFFRIGIDYISIVKNGDLLNLNCELSERYMLLYEFAKYKFVSLQINDMQKYFKDIDLKYLYNSIAYILKDGKYNSRYLMLTKVTIFIALVVECREDIISNFDSKNIEEKNINISRKISEFIEEEFLIKVNEECMLNIAYYLNMLHTMHVIEDYIRNDMSDEEYNLYRDKILKIAKKFNINLVKDSEFFNDMILHIIIAVKRIKLGIKIYNPLRENLKNKYPLLFEFANKLVADISRNESIKFDFNELSYIVAYLSTIVYEELESLRCIRDINVLLVVSDGRANLNYIYNEIKKNIAYDGVKFKKVCYLTEIDRTDIKGKFDLIITTSKEDVKFTIDDYMEIRKTFDIVERNRVIGEIDKIRSRVIEEKIESLFDYYFSDEIFLSIEQETSQEKIIKEIANIFNVDISKRIPMIISLKNGIGLFYKLDDNVESDKMAIIKLKNSITWVDDKVKIIVAILDKSHNINEINVIITYILELAEKADFNEKLRNCKNMCDLKRLLIELYLKDVLN
ncbi:MAG: PRD domain-containing protein [Clostridium sp.]|nr:PRD domain-containing protein [Clostridium sp.]